MLSLNKIKKGFFIEINNEPFLVLEAAHRKLGRAGALLNVKLKHLISGNTLSKTLQGKEKIEEIELTRRKANFLYESQGKFNFMDKATFEEISLDKSQIGEKAQVLKEGQETTILFYKKKPINIELPRTVILKVTEAPPNIRGDTAGTARKEVVLETGLKVAVPLFINKNDLIKVDSETRKYKERA